MDLKEIENRSDVETLVNKFYAKVLKDDLIGFFFKDVVHLNWDQHMPTMHDFWESTLFGLAKYRGNPMLKHIELNRKSAMKAKHFDRWLSLWEETVKENFHGDIAEDAINKATQIGGLMKFKIENSR